MYLFKKQLIIRINILQKMQTPYMFCTKKMFSIQKCPHLTDIKIGLVQAELLKDKGAVY